MDFLTLAKKRYSVRAYTKQKVEKEKLDAILEAAHVAPTGGNCQPQHLIVVQSDEGLRKIGKGINFPISLKRKVLSIKCHRISALYFPPIKSRVASTGQLKVLGHFIFLFPTLSF